MADEDDKKEQEDAKVEEIEEKAAEEKTTEEKTSGIGALTWIVMAVIVVLCAGSGFIVGRILAGSPSAETAESSQKDEIAQSDILKQGNSATDSQKSWYYDLEPVVANLDEPGVTRYVRAILTLEVSPEVDRKKAEVFFKQKNPILTNWITVYLASLTLEDARGDKNLKRIQYQILDAFNEMLFPDAKPQIKHVLFKEFAIQ